MRGGRLEFGNKCDLCRSGAGGELARGLPKRKERCWRGSRFYPQVEAPVDAATMCLSRRQVFRWTSEGLPCIFVLSIWGELIRILQLASGSCQLKPAQTASTTDLSNNLRHHHHIHMLARDPPVSNLVRMPHSPLGGKCIEKVYLQPRRQKKKRQTRKEKVADVIVCKPFPRQYPPFPNQWHSYLPTECS